MGDGSGCDDAPANGLNGLCPNRAIVLIGHRVPAGMVQVAIFALASSPHTISAIRNQAACKLWMPILSLTQMRQI